ncbi:MAG: hypothetical protein K6E26_08140 [Clostridiales bacterium]|nr:hypothetical protein [Clostridiales bacterium]MCR5275318.1 hypothetical protein [Clostridiales bacterium]
MRHSARAEHSASVSQDIRPEIQEPVSTVENPLMEELHTVSSSSVPAWKTQSVVVTQEAKDPFRSNTMFGSIDEEFTGTESRPVAPTNATIIKEKEVKEKFSYSDDQLVYKKGMKFGERVAVTFRKIAVWFSDQWDKYVLFMKNHFPSIFEGHNVSLIMAIGCAILFILIGVIVVTALALR